MKICICCFGLFHRPKQKESIIISKKTNKKNLKININESNNNSNLIFQRRRRSVFQDIGQINQLNNFPSNQVSPKKPENKISNSPCFSKNSPIRKRINETPKSLYELKDTFRCLFCGGTKCPCEDYKTNPKNAIEGLNCDIIKNEIYASQRPSNVLIEKYNLVKKFIQNNIGLIVNLQRPGEHPYCGPNALDPLSGYSYSPSIFSSEGIKVRLSGWKDMDVPDSLYFMLDIIKEIYQMIKIKKKKVLVHCHAGNGRTGIVVACYLIYTYNYDAEEAVKILRSFRKKCIEKNAQMKYCIKFNQFIVQLRKIFTSEKYDVDYFIKHQSDLCLEDYNKKLIIPTMIWITFDILYKLKSSNYYTNDAIYKALNGALEIRESDYKELINIVDEINNGNWNSLQNNKKIVIICELFYNWLEDCVTYCISPKKINEMFLDNNFKILIIDITNGNNDKRLIKSISDHIENYLKKLEMEIIKYITKFLCNIYPNEDDDNIMEYKRMVEKISIYLLGFNIDLLLYFKSKSDENKIDEEIEDDYDIGIQISIKDCIQSIENLILIFEFLRIKLSYSTHHPVNNSNYLSVNNNDNHSNHLNYKKTNETLRSVFTNQEESNEGSFVNQKLITSNRLDIGKNDKNNKLNLSILQGKDFKNKIKKSCSPIKSHLIDLEHENKLKKSITPFRTKFLDFQGMSNQINKSPTLKPKSSFIKSNNLNDSKIILKNYNNDNIPIIKINYVEKKE